MKSCFVQDLAKSLIIMHGLTVEEAARRVGIPSENVQAFLAGVTMALAPEHTEKLLYSLGVGLNDAKEVGLLSRCVHILSLDLREASVVVLQPLFYLLDEFTVMKLPVEKKRTTPVLMWNDNVRILLRVRRKPFKNISLHLLGIAKNEQAYKGKSVPPEYVRSIFGGHLGMIDYDALASGCYPNWALLRRIANSHNIRFEQILGYMERQSRDARGLTPEAYRQGFSILKSQGAEGEGREQKEANG